MCEGLYKQVAVLGREEEGNKSFFKKVFTYLVWEQVNC